MTPSRAARPLLARALPLLLATGLASVVRAAEPAAAPVSDHGDPTAEKAAADPLDLGRGLRYFRPGADGNRETLAAAGTSAALVLDLRLATEADTVTVRELLAARSATRPAFVLLGAATPEALRAAVPSVPGVLTLAAKDSGIGAGLPLAVDASLDRQAAEALAAGRAPRELFAPPIEKKRFDEEQLVQNHANGRLGTEPTAVRPEPVAAPAESQPAAAPVPLQDLLLERAVGLHRALLALRRIPDHS